MEPEKAQGKRGFPAVAAAIARRHSRSGQHQQRGLQRKSFLPARLGNIARIRSRVFRAAIAEIQGQRDVADAVGRKIDLGRQSAPPRA